MVPGSATSGPAASRRAHKAETLPRSPGNDRRRDFRVFFHRRNPPRLRAVGDKAVGKQQHGRHVLHGDLAGPESIVKTIRRRARSHDHQRALAVAAPQRLIQVGLLGFGRQTRRRTSALHVDDHQRQLGHHGQPIASDLSDRPGPEVVVTAKLPAYAAPMAVQMPDISSSA